MNEICVKLTDTSVTIFSDDRCMCTFTGNITIEQGNKDYLSAPEAAKLLGVGIKTFRNLSVRGMVPQGVIKDGKTVYERVQIQAFKESLI